MMSSFHPLRGLRLPGVVACLLSCTVMSDTARAAVNGLTPAQYKNTAVVTASPDQYENNSSNNTATVAVLPKAMVVSKTADTSAWSSPVMVGDQVTYRITATNHGLLGISNLSVTDSIIPSSDISLLSGDVNSNSILDADEVWVWQGVYEITQTDLDSNGGGDADLDNTATVSSDELDPLSASVDVPIVQAPQIIVEKTVDSGTVSAPGQLSYTIEVVNAGNVSLSNLNVADTLPDGTAATLVGPGNDGGNAGVLDVGETWQYSASYVVSQSDIDNGQPIVNTVAVSSTETDDGLFNATATTTINTIPSFSVEKTVDADEISVPGVLSYEIRIDNTGNTTLTNIVVEDVLPDGTVATVTGPTGDGGINGAIDVGESWVYSATYTATQSDINSGELLVNRVSVTTDEAGAGEDTAQTAITQLPSLTIVKAAVETGFTAAGDVIPYAFLITNTGNLLLTDVVIIDSLADAGSLLCQPPGSPVSSPLSEGPFTLNPSQQMNCTALHTVTMADVISNRVDNQAQVTALDQQGVPVTASSEIVSVTLSIVPPVATDDTFNSLDSQVAVTLEAAANDTDANGDLQLSSVSLLEPAAVDTDNDGDFDTLNVAGVGSWVVDNNTGEVLFTPQNGFTGDPASVTYTVEDLTGQVSNVAVLTIDYPQSAPLAQHDVKINPDPASPDNPTTIDLLADNGNGVDSDAEGDLDIQTLNIVNPDAIDVDGDGDSDRLVVAGEGVWVLANNTGEITFTPVAGFMYDPTPISYTVSDRTGIVSNVATITVDYPQTAPLAIDDEKLEQPLARPVVIAVVTNDIDPENNLDPTTVRLINPATEDAVTVLPVAGQGVWHVDENTGAVTFTPDDGFLSDPSPVEYTVRDSTDIESNRATITVTFEPPGSIGGFVWLDRDRDGQIGTDEQRLVGWTVRLLDENGNLVATTITDEIGEYIFVDLIPANYTVAFFNEAGVFMDSVDTLATVRSDQRLLLPFAITPSGVVYDSIERTPIEGVKLTLLNTDGDIIDQSCLRENQQGQITRQDGLYNFDVVHGAHPSCSGSEVYKITITAVPDAYHANFSSVIRQQGAASCGNAEIGCAVSDTFESAAEEILCTVDALQNSGACEVQAQPGAPHPDEDTRYYTELAMEAGDQAVIFNHLPIDARANDAEILLSKTADRRTTSIGSMVRYTITAENLKTTPAVRVAVVDTPPVGFSVAPGSAVLTRNGADATFNTEDDIREPLVVITGSTLSFDELNFAAGETLRISYVMRVNTGVINGSYVNRATATGPNGETSNQALAEIEVVSDPALGQATLIGKVFFDRDSDGIQDSATVSGLKLSSRYYGEMHLPPLPARANASQDPSVDTLTINMPKSAASDVQITTSEGTRLSVGRDGLVTQAHVGEISGGMSSQNIRVCTQWTVDTPTLPDGRRGLEATDILQIQLTNTGINEPGIAGVRLATVNGLIIETDGYGRFHIPDVDVGTGIGRNFILKIDPSSLPEGAVFTTDNPYLLRLDNSALNRMNFGVQLPGEVDSVSHHCEPALAAARSVVEVRLETSFFDKNSVSVTAAQRGIVDAIADAVREHRAANIIVATTADHEETDVSAIELAKRRASAIRELLLSRLGVGLMADVVVESEQESLR